MILAALAAAKHQAQDRHFHDHSQTLPVSQGDVKVALLLERGFRYIVTICLLALALFRPLFSTASMVLSSCGQCFTRVKEESVPKRRGHKRQKKPVLEL